MKYIVEIDWLRENLYQDNIRIVDCRFSLSDPHLGVKEYKENHIPGAVYFDLEKDLSSSPEKHGGRHPLPKIDQIKEKLENAGIDDGVKVVAYDDGGGEYASRFWWILTYLGHKDVQILNGGIKAWNLKQYPVDNILPSFKNTCFTVSLQDNMVAKMIDIKNNIEEQKTILIDSRAHNRYIGLEEPIDKKAGHIPGAINKVWTEGFHKGYWKSAEEQKERFKDIKPSDSIIVYCGSGVTATPNIIALLEAGYTHIKLYPGSYSDWVSYDENPIETDL
ncbi:sulfurtransferase [Heyndrickxia sp. NPDC080065]|uniref:sulfurtransferase n=1 Tax=Heyndrickxia sp. NPDC080065 TaxID=3390568 RepID=UPI003D07580A